MLNLKFFIVSLRALLHNKQNFSLKPNKMYSLIYISELIHETHVHFEEFCDASLSSTCYNNMQCSEVISSSLHCQSEDMKINTFFHTEYIFATDGKPWSADDRRQNLNRC